MGERLKKKYTIAEARVRFPEITQGFVTTFNLSTLKHAIQLQSKSKIYNYNSSPVS